jgi:hypothetical protein
MSVEGGYVIKEVIFLVCWREIDVVTRRGHEDGSFLGDG